MRQCSGIGSALFVLPSRSEAFPNGAIEAMAAGLPVVASAVGGLLDLAGPGVVVTPPRDVSALRSAVSELLADPDRRRELGEAARSRAAQAFAWRPTVDRTIEAYEDAIAARVS